MVIDSDFCNKQQYFYVSLCNLYTSTALSLDEDSNGEVDKEELKHCFQKLEISFTEEELTDVFEACDINEDMGMKFNEFIVFLCLVYLLNKPAVSFMAHTVKRLLFFFSSCYDFL
jgi:hypothetical protein